MAAKNTTDVFVERFPVDILDHQVELYSADNIHALPGEIFVLNAAGEAVRCDLGVAGHPTAPVYVCVINTQFRADAGGAAMAIDGTRKTVMSCLGAGAFEIDIDVADCVVNVNTNGAPALGHLIIKSPTTPGKLETIAPAALQALVPGTYSQIVASNGLVLGRVARGVDSKGKFRARFTL